VSAGFYSELRKFIFAADCADPREENFATVQMTNLNRKARKDREEKL
jgi:hypothetical protein